MSTFTAGLAELSDSERWPEALARLRQLVQETDAISGGWLSHARKLLHQCQVQLGTFFTSASNALIVKTTGHAVAWRDLLHQRQLQLCALHICGQSTFFCAVQGCHSLVHLSSSVRVAKHAVACKQEFLVPVHGVLA